MHRPSLTECPICGKFVKLELANEHVDRCLQDSASLHDGSDQRAEGASPTPPSPRSHQKSFLDVLKSSGTKPKATVTEKSVTRGQNAAKRGKLNMAGNTDSTPPSKKIRFDANVGAEGRQQTSRKVQEPSAKASKRSFMPLAERMRPRILADYVGQSKVIGDNTLLRTLLEAEQVPSMILWGPPGCGKTTLAHIIANNAKTHNTARFVTLSATTSGVNDVKEVMKAAKNEQTMFNRKTILFIDEIHRFNKTQQDTFLPFVENGTITLIGATTENPSFKLNNALLSRCRVIVLDKLSTEEIEKILRRALDDLGVAIVNENSGGDPRCGPGTEDRCATDATASSVRPTAMIDKGAVHSLACLCDGDARIALNGLQLAVQSRLAMATNTRHNEKPTETTSTSGKAPQQVHDDGNFTSSLHSTPGENQTHTPVKITVSDIKEGLQRTHKMYDRVGEEHYNAISALHKSIRGGDANAALYWLARMLVGGEDPLFIARRLVRCASEDIGLADPVALNQAVAAYQACHFIGMPECDVILSQAVVYLARAPKSIEVYEAYGKARQCVKDWQGPQPCVPLHIRNAPTSLMKNLGYGKGYMYNPAFDGPVDQTYLPPELDGVDFFRKSRR